MKNFANAKFLSQDSVTVYALNVSTTEFTKTIDVQEETEHDRAYCDCGLSCSFKKGVWCTKCKPGIEEAFM